MSEILAVGDPRLQQRSSPVRTNDPKIGEHVAALTQALKTFRAAHGWGRAIALPQLGISKRIVVFDLGSGPYAMLNPKIEWLSPETVEVWDDCMCLPSIAVKVRRARSLTLSFLDESLRLCRFERVAQEQAELIQHELDHLDGILFTERMIHKWGVIAREYQDRAEPMPNCLGKPVGSAHPAALDVRVVRNGSRGGGLLRSDPIP